MSLVVAPIIFCDNLNAIYLTCNPIFYTHTKHIEINFYFVYDLVQKQLLDVQYVSAFDQLVDSLMKLILVSQLLSYKLLVISSPLT